MTSLLLYLLLWVWDNRSFNTIDQSNRDKREAESAYIEQNYKKAARLYKEITYGSIFSEPASRLYLAHAYFQIDSLQLAQSEYTLLEHVADPAIASAANTQLALLTCQNGDTSAALIYLKTALRHDPYNQTARYDYQVLKTVFSGKVPDAPATQPELSPPPPQLTTTSEQQEVELAAQREELLERLRRLNMSEEQARSILDAMKSNEAQYIYQLRRRQYYDQSERSKVVEW
ncbi:hypothetical protein [Persicitalea sp.]|uniref:hypothetical protein n=1 Tax=Persicitalea sp. TaxID=3100273 RepID=UPI003593F770